MVKNRSGGRKFIFEVTVLALMALGLTSCGRVSMAPVFFGSDHSPRAERGSDHASSTTGIVRVRRGDTLSEIAMQHRVSTRELARANGIRAPFTIVVGQELRLPNVPTHHVTRGESLSEIAERYDMSTQDLARANNLRRPYLIFAGQDLNIPWSSASNSSGNAGAVERSTRTRTAARVRPRRDHRVATNSATARAATTQSTISQRARPTPRPRTAQTATATRRVSPQPATVSSAASLVAPPQSGEGFMWPVAGRILSSYGPKEGGTHNDGINIAVPAGTPIMAAEDGVVIYSGNEMPGYGSLVLIRHSDGYVTAYAHTSRSFVSQGQVVERGERIALAGRSGRVTEPQLHFEVRHNSRAINPTRILTGA